MGELITFDSPAYKSLDEKIDKLLTIYIKTAEELKGIKGNRLISLKEAMAEYRRGKSWLLAHKADIGYRQIDGGSIEFYTDDLDKYFSKYKIQRKF